MLAHFVYLGFDRRLNSQQMSRSRSASFPLSYWTFFLLSAAYAYDAGLATSLNPQLQILNGVNPMHVCVGEEIQLVGMWSVDRPVTHLEINSTEVDLVLVERNFKGHFLKTCLKNRLCVLTVRLNASSTSTYRFLAQGDNTTYPSETASIIARSKSLAVANKLPCKVKVN